MFYNKIPDTDIEVSAITFGAWAIGGWLWGGTKEKDALESIDASLQHGITTIDTAPVYGFGYSEELVGKAIKGKRDKVQILTKFGLRWDIAEGEFYFKTSGTNNQELDIYRCAKAKSIIEECENSLKRLGTDYIDLYQIHWPDKTTPPEETFEAVNKLKEQGKIRAIGVCNYDSELLSKAMKIAPVITNQVPYSMVQREIENELVPFCLENNKGIIAYSPLQRGLLTGKITEDYTFNKGDHRASNPYFKTINRSRVNTFLSSLDGMKNKYNCTTAQLIINWTLKQPAVIVALVGARNTKQAEENASACAFELEQTDIEEINSKLEDLKLEL